MIDRQLEACWTSLTIYRRVLRTPAQRRLWLDRMLSPLARESRNPRLRRSLRTFIAREERMLSPAAEAPR
jgi:hypothetical protein